MKTFAVVMPVRNEERHLRVALRAVLSQSRRPDVVHVVDDGSTDETPGILREFAARDSRLVVATLPANVGAFQAVAPVIATVEQDFVYVGSANDVVLPGAFAELMALADEYPDAAALTGGTGVLADGRVMPVHDRWLPSPGFIPAERVSAELDRPGVFLRGLAVLQRTDLTREVWADLPALLWLADTWLMHVLAFRHGIAATPALVAAVRPHEGSIGGRIENLDDRCQVGEALAGLLNARRYRDIRGRFLKSGLMQIGAVRRPVREYVRQRALAA